MDHRAHPESDSMPAAQPWSEAENNLLKTLIARHTGSNGIISWKYIATAFPSRTIGALQSRWYKGSHDKPASPRWRQRWSTDENDLLKLLLAGRTGSDGTVTQAEWKLLTAQHFPERTPPGVQTHWWDLLHPDRKKFTRYIRSAEEEPFSSEDEDARDFDETDSVAVTARATGDSDGRSRVSSRLPWTEEQDANLLELALKHNLSGQRKGWNDLVPYFEGRSAEALRQRGRRLLMDNDESRRAGDHEGMQSMSGVAEPLNHSEILAPPAGMPQRRLPPDAIPSTTPLRHPAVPYSQRPPSLAIASETYGSNGRGSTEPQATFGLALASPQRPAPPSQPTVKASVDPAREAESNQAQILGKRARNLEDSDSFGHSKPSPRATPFDDSKLLASSSSRPPQYSATAGTFDTNLHLYQKYGMPQAPSTQLRTISPSPSPSLFLAPRSRSQSVLPSSTAPQPHHPTPTFPTIDSHFHPFHPPLLRFLTNISPALAQHGKLFLRAGMTSTGRLANLLKMSNEELEAGGLLDFLAAGGEGEDGEVLKGLPPFLLGGVLLKGLERMRREVGVKFAAQMGQMFKEGKRLALLKFSSDMHASNRGEEIQLDGSGDSSLGKRVRDERGIISRSSNPATASNVHNTTSPAHHNVFAKAPSLPDKVSGPSKSFIAPPHLKPPTQNATWKPDAVCHSPESQSLAPQLKRHKDEHSINPKDSRFQPFTNMTPKVAPPPNATLLSTSAAADTKPGFGPTLSSLIPSPTSSGAHTKPMHPPTSQHTFDFTLLRFLTHLSPSLAPHSKLFLLSGLTSNERLAKLLLMSNEELKEGGLLDSLAVGGLGKNGEMVKGLPPFLLGGVFLKGLERVRKERTQETSE
ncbi:hypothetical protein P7C70_g8572, partial [Phenoliferia sp. Uapishka_3]